MQAPPLPTDEVERQLALDRYGITDTPPEAGFDRLTDLAHSIFTVPIALVTLVDRNRQWFKACYGLSVTETPRSVSFCGHAILSDEIFVILDAATDARFSDNPLVTGPPYIRFYAGAPLINPQGKRLGTFCLLDTTPHSEFTARERQQLRILADTATDQIVLRRTIESAREAQLRWELVLKANNDGIWDWDTLTNKVFHSTRWKEILGYDNSDALNDAENWDALLHPDDTERVKTCLARYLNRELPVYQLEYRMRAKDGCYRWILARGQAIWDEAGKPVRMVGSHTDITERKQLERELLQSQHELQQRNSDLEEAVAAKSELLSRMSHEFRTPLNAILGFSQLLQELTTLSPEQAEYVEEILKGGRYLLTLINELLEIVRIEAGKVSLSIEPVQARTPLCEALDMIRPLAAQRKIELKWDPNTFDSAWVYADAQRMKQVFLNLLSNAIKYNREGGSVTINCRQGPSETVEFEVHDTGLGIAPDKLPRLFTPFDRLGAEQTGVEGTGLGLALTRRLTEAMSGSISVESSLQQGSTFRVSLPVAANPETRSPEPEEQATVEAIPETAATVLYIEDNLTNLKLVQKIISRRPHWQLISAMQGTLGLELARKHAPTCILLDLHLPDLPGDQVLQRLREDPETARIPVIMLSADATPGQVNRLKQAGVADYLTKPLDVKRFLATLDTLIETSVPA